MHPTRTPHIDSIIKDEQALEGKQTLMRRQRSVPLLNGVSMVFAMAAGPVLATGIKMVMETGIAAISAGALSTLGIAAALGAVAVTASIMASRKSQSNYIDNAEFNSQENARHIAQALKKEGVCVVPAAQQTTAEENAPALRNDGKSWQETVSGTQAPATEIAPNANGGYAAAIERQRSNQQQIVVS